MTPERWQQLKNLYAEAEQVDGAKRDELVAAADPELAGPCRRLLAAGGSEGFLDRALPLFDDTAMAPPTTHAFSAGDRLCDRFDIVRFIAHGGMGEVYEAYDSGLREAVALKTVRASAGADARAAEAFRREVRRSRAITSQHVCRVHDLFSHQPGGGAPAVLFLSMRLLNGETLASRIKRLGKMSPEEALPLLRDIADGIDTAHGAQIIHGDLKGGNVMLTHDAGGRLSACITDFGLARRIVHAADDTETVTDSAPRGGTPAWMAPEQVEGQPAGPEADIYAFGLIAYEMTTGRLPFDGETPELVVRRRLTDPPHPARRFTPQLAPSWEYALMRCLDRDPAKRFPTATAFVEAIESGRRRPRRTALWLKVVAAAVLCLAAALAWRPVRRQIVNVIHPVAPGRSIAVLPFHRLDPTPDSFSDGFTEELIHALGQVRGIRVLGPESSFYFKSSDLPPREIGRKLGVTHLLTGSVHRLDQQIRVIARLIDTADGSQIWSREVTRDERDVFLLRDDIARMVSREFRVNLAGMGVPAQTIDAAGLSARDLYWTGRLHLRQRTDEGVRASLDYFRQAIARDPSFAPGYCGLADALFVVAERDLLPPDQALAEASRAARKAVQIDSRLPDAWVSLAQITSIFDHDLDEAERLFRRALEMDPKSAAAWQWYSYQLVKQRRFAEAIHAAEAAVEADPLSMPANINLAVVYLYSGVDDHAVQQCRKLSQMDSQLFFEHPMVAIVFAHKGLVGEALHEMESVPEARRDHRIMLRVWVEVYALAGMREQAAQALERLVARYRQGGVPVSYVAVGYAAVGDKDRAIEWLGRALAARDAFASVANAYPAFDSIRPDPRYAALMAQLGIKVQTASGSSAPR